MTQPKKQEAATGRKSDEQRKAELATERTPAERVADAITGIDDKALARENLCPHYLNLSGTSVTDEGLTTLVGRVPELRTLNLVNCAGISAKGFTEVTKFPNLEVLEVSGAQLTDEVAAILSGCPALRRIRVTGKARACGGALKELNLVLRRRRPS